ncbi:MAG: hypothetical protein WD069_19910 [Planctomycetales bacterium]
MRISHSTSISVAGSAPRSVTFGLLLLCLIGAPGCPENRPPSTTPNPRPAPLPTGRGEFRSPARTEGEKIQPTELLGTWRGQVWQLSPGGAWQEADAARFAIAAAEAPAGERRRASLAPPERLSEHPSITVRLTVEEKHFATPGIEGAAVGITHSSAANVSTDDRRSSGTERSFLFRREADGSLLLERGGDRLKLKSLDGDRLAVHGTVATVDGQPIHPSGFEMLLVKESAVDDAERE